MCTRSGQYYEFKINSHYSYQLYSDNEGFVSFFSNKIIGNKYIISGINVSIPYGTDTMLIEKVSKSEIILHSRFGEIRLEKLNTVLPDVDSSNFENWQIKLLNGFSRRIDKEACLDLRTEEEKTPPELGVVYDDFEDIIDLPYIPELDDIEDQDTENNIQFLEDSIPVWARPIFEEVSLELRRPIILEPQFLMADFSGDGSTDIAIIVQHKENNKKGILFIFQKTKKSYLIGAGNKFKNGGDDFYWADSWELFEDPKTYEMTFLDNGDIDGTREVNLERVAISIREDEGSGGLIYYDGSQFIWIHQGD